MSNFFLESMNTYNKDLYLEYYYLTENIKAKVENVIIEKLFTMIKARYNELDLVIVHQTGGDITKLHNFNYVLEVIKFGEEYLVPKLNLKENQTQFKAVTALLTNYLNTIKMTIANMQKFKPDFMHAYQSNNEFVKFLYASTVTGLIMTTNLLFTFMIDYVKDNQSDSFVIEFKKSFSGDRLTLLQTLIGNVGKFNELCDKGNINAIFNKPMTEQTNLNEEAISTGFMLLFGIAGAIALFYSIKGLVWYFYKVRQSVSDYLEVLAEMVQLNAEMIKNQKDPVAKKMFGGFKSNKEIVAKQEKWVVRLRSWAKKMDVSVDMADSEIKRESPKEDKSLYATTTTSDMPKNEDLPQEQKPVMNSIII